MGPCHYWATERVALPTSGQTDPTDVEILEILGTGSTHSLVNEIGAAPPSQEEVDNNAAHF